MNGVLTGGATMASVECKQSLNGHKYSIWSLELADDRLYSGSSDGTIKVLNSIIGEVNLTNYLTSSGLGFGRHRRYQVP